MLRPPRSATVARRPAFPGDIEFSYRVTETAMRAYVELTWGAWDRAVQLENHARSFNPATHQVVVVDDVPAGILSVAVCDSHVQLEKIYLLPEFQGRGIGSRLLQQILASAAADAKPVRLRVLRVNVGAQRMYIRHGFIITSDTQERVYMEARPRQ